MNWKLSLALGAVLLGSVGAASAEGFDKSKLSLGAGYGFGNSGTISVRGDYDITGVISSISSDIPIVARVGFDRYSLDYNLGFLDYSWAYNIFYGGAYADFGKKLNLDKKIHPFAGLGFGFGSASCSGNICGATPTVGGFYYIGGVKYDFLPNVDGELSLNQFAGFSLGANYKF